MFRIRPVLIKQSIGSQITSARQMSSSTACSTCFDTARTTPRIAYPQHSPSGPMSNALEAGVSRSGLVCAFQIRGLPAPSDRLLELGARRRRLRARLSRPRPATGLKTGELVASISSALGCCANCSGALLSELLAQTSGVDSDLSILV